jgi:hypothetical protein
MPDAPSQRVRLSTSSWKPLLDAAQTRALAAELEAGKVLELPMLAFPLKRQRERSFLDIRWSDVKAKNISYDPIGAVLRGACGQPGELAELKQLVARFHDSAIGLIQRLLPNYAAALRPAQASLRLWPVAGRKVSWRKDDSRLHVDAFPSRPNRGERILRVFTNVNPGNEARVWRIGEPFPDLARRFLPEIARPLPGSAAILAALHITKSRRSEYDHTMLALHDRMKADLAYQRDAPQETIHFAPGTTWICFSDQTSHAAMSGQFMLEQTLNLPVEALYDPDSSPLRILERLRGRRLVAD